MIGYKTGHKIGKNNDGDRNVVLLQVQISDEDDVQTVQLYNPSGDDSIPVNGSEIIIIMIDETWKIGIAADQLKESKVAAGEKRIYSLDSSGDIAASLWLKSDGKNYFNEGSKSAVSFKDLSTALSNLDAQIQAELVKISTGIGSAGGAYTPGTITTDISASEVDEVLLP